MLGDFKKVRRPSVANSFRPRSRMQDRNFSVRKYGSLLDCSVHPLDLPARPGILDLRELLLDAVFAADPIKNMGEVVDIAGAIGELDPVAPTKRIGGSGQDSGARNFSLLARTTRGDHGQSEFL
jgi:hypothetical protein